MTLERKVGIVLRENHISYWSEGQTQILEEFVLRDYKPPRPFEEYYHKHPPQIPISITRASKWRTRGGTK